MDRPAAMRPLDEAADAIRRLDDYDTTAELSSAVLQVAAAVERSLRTLLRSDPSASDDHRLSARSADFPYESVVQSLRSRNRISLELAGGVHELTTAAARAGEQAARPADGDLARNVVQRLRRELTAGAAAEPASPRLDTPATGPAAEPADEGGSERGNPTRTGRWMAYLAAAFAAVFVLGLAWATMRGGVQDHEQALAAFRAGRLDSAALAFEQRLEARPGDVTSMLYLARIYRRQSRWPEAADVLRTAVATAPDDADVRRELGHLFLDLRQPSAAIRQYERALEREPEEELNWIGLIRAMRSAGDPRAERLLQDAPPDVQAALRRAPESDDG